MRKPRRVTQADYHAAGRGLARDVSEGLAAIERRKLAHGRVADADGRFPPEAPYPGMSIRQQHFIRGVSTATAEDFGDVRIMDYGADSKTRYRVASFCPGYETSYPGDTPKMNPERDDWCATLEEASDFFDIYVADAKLRGWTAVSPTGRTLDAA
jgi:hypothetical protein